MEINRNVGYFCPDNHLPSKRTFIMQKISSFQILTLAILIPHILLGGSSSKFSIHPNAGKLNFKPKHELLARDVSKTEHLSCIEDIILFSQEDIDMFPINYPGCTELQGALYIYDVSKDITNLNGLADIISIAGGLYIGQTENLVTLDGLENLTTLGNLVLENNTAITNVNALSNVSGNVSNVIVTQNQALVNLIGFEGILLITESLTISENPALTSLEGLNNISSIENDLIILDNFSLNSLDGFISLTGEIKIVYIAGNENLGDIGGLNGISEIEVGFEIANNPSLPVCNIESICNNLINQIGFTVIYNNANGCNSTGQVTEMCLGLECVSVTSPANGSNNVPLDAIFSWPNAMGATGYKIKIGTTPGGNELLVLTDVGNVTQYQPVNLLPGYTQIFVQIVTYNENHEFTHCFEVSFTTMPEVLPCANLLSPANGANVDLAFFSSVLTFNWEPVLPGLTYEFYLGSSPEDATLVTTIAGSSLAVTQGMFDTLFVEKQTYSWFVIPLQFSPNISDCYESSRSFTLNCFNFGHHHFQSISTDGDIEIQMSGLVPFQLDDITVSIDVYNDINDPEPFMIAEAYPGLHLPSLNYIKSIPGMPTGGNLKRTCVDGTMLTLSTLIPAETFHYCNECIPYQGPEGPAIDHPRCVIVNEDQTINLTMKSAYFLPGNYDFDGEFPDNSTGVPTPGKELFFNFSPEETALYGIQIHEVSNNSFISYLYKEDDGVTACDPIGWTGLARVNGQQVFNVGTLEAGKNYKFVMAAEDTISTRHSFTIFRPTEFECPQNQELCINSDAIILEGDGEYSGPGISEGSFYPSVAGEGIHEITYTMNDQSCDFDITVLGLPDVTCPENLSICANEDSFGIIGGAPLNGIYEGFGVTEGIFHPGLAEIGENTLNYTVTDEQGCLNSCSFIFSVLDHSSIEATISAINEEFCAGNSTTIEVSGPANGTVTIEVNGEPGPVIPLDAFGNGSIGTGPLSITTIYSLATASSTECSNAVSGSVQVIVNPNPIVTCGTYGIACDIDPLIPLIGSPTGGTWSGVGVSGDNFDPASGTQLLTYNFTDQNGCSNTCSVTIQVEISSTFFADADGDGAGDPEESIQTCEQPVGFVSNSLDNCPNDPLKTDPGICGCGTADTDTDGDDTPDCIDGCPNDPNKTAPGACGCGVQDVPFTWFADIDGDGFGNPNSSQSGFTCIQPAGFVANSLDNCPNNPLKTDPGICGCGTADTDTDGDDTPDCIDGCPNDPNKTAPGTCGCGVQDVPFTWFADADGDGFGDPNSSQNGFTCIQPAGFVANSQDCDDTNANVNPNASDSNCDGIDNNCNGETDEDFVPENCEECVDGEIINTLLAWFADTDGDGFGDPNDSQEACEQPVGFVSNSLDNCPNDPLKTDPGICGCGTADTDTDGDDTPDCIDGCPNDPNKTAPGTCGCGVQDVPFTWFADADGDGFGDPNSSQNGFTCIQPAGFVANNEDCDDQDPLIHPEADESCNGIDDNCNELLDEGCGAISISGIGNQVIVNGSVMPNPFDGTNMGSAILYATLEKTFVIRNNGEFTIDLNGSPMIQLEGDESNFFTILSQPASSILEAGDSVTFVIRYLGNSAFGLKEAIVVVPNTDPGNDPYQFAIAAATSGPIIQIRGNAININNGDLAPSTFDFSDFGPVAYNGSRTVTFAIHNLGSQILSLTGTPLIQISGADSDMFTVTTPPPNQISVNSNRLFAIRFNGTEVGEFQANITVLNNDLANGEYVFAIKATVLAPNMQVRFNSISGQIIENGDDEPGVNKGTDYGIVAVNGSKSHTFYVRNLNGGVLSLIGTPRVQKSGADAGMFSVTTIPALNIGAGSSSIMRIAYQPKAMGVHEVTIVIPTNEPGKNPYAFTIKGQTPNASGVYEPGIHEASILHEDAITADIYPNPAYDELQLNLNGVKEPGEAYLIDAYGRKVKTVIISNGNNRIIIDDLPNGMYVIVMPGVKLGLTAFFKN
jgi:hypothetical protein